MIQASALLDSAPASRVGQSFIRTVFKALIYQQVDYALLRGYEALRSTSGRHEIDLLVAPHHLSRLTGILIESGFAKLPSWGHAPHHFFIAYDGDTDMWWKLDVVTHLRYGSRIRGMQVGDAESWLRGSGPDHRLSPEDEFIGLLLHCLLDRSAFTSEHQMRLTALQKELEENQDAEQKTAHQVERRLAPAITWDLVSRAIETQNWHLLIQRRGFLVRQLFWDDPFMTAWRYLSGRWLRFMRPLLFALCRPGWAVALVGPDGAGKSTLANALTQERHLRARQIYMGTAIDAANTGLPTTRWLAHHRGSRRNAARSKTRSLFKGLSFTNRVTEQWYRCGAARFYRRRGGLVIFDRYIYDVSAEGVPTPARRFRRWLLRAGAPTPNLLVVLDAPAHVLYERKGEHTPDRLEQMRCAYLELRDRFPQTVVVDATQDASTVRKKVISLIWSHCAVESSRAVDLI